MRRLHLVLIVLGVTLTQCGGLCVAKPNTPQIHVDAAKSLHPKYREALLALLAKSSDPLSSDELRNFEAILEENGWPTVQSTGKDGVNAAAILVLRSTGDHLFQNKVENIVWGGRIYLDVNASAAARWIDNIEYRHNHKQIFGTLLRLRAGIVIESAPLEKDRADVLRDFGGLPLLKSYIAEVQKRINLGESLSQANAFPEFAKNFTPYSNPILREKLNDMAAKDQEARSACAEVQTRPNSTACKKVGLIDSSNLPEIENIFRQYGFPTASMVGRDGVSSFFLLVQHAVTNRKLQESVLNAAAPLLSDGDLAHQEYALLDDRVRLARGKKQLYGSQVNLGKDGLARLLPVQDPVDLDKRRRKMAMGSESGYFSDICKTYHLNKSLHAKNCQSQLTSQLLHMQLAGSSLPSAAASLPVKKALQK